MRVVGITIGLSLVLMGCAAPAGTVPGGLDLGRTDKADLAEIEPAQVIGLLRVTNEATLEQLVNGVGMSRHTAQGIVGHRERDLDGFTSLDELNTVPSVERETVNALGRYALSQGYVDTTSWHDGLPETPLSSTLDLSLALRDYAECGTAGGCGGSVYYTRGTSCGIEGSISDGFSVTCVDDESMAHLTLEATGTVAMEIDGGGRFELRTADGWPELLVSGYLTNRGGDTYMVVQQYIVLYSDGADEARVSRLSLYPIQSTVDLRP